MSTNRFRETAVVLVKGLFWRCAVDSYSIAMLHNAVRRNIIQVNVLFCTKISFIDCNKSISPDREVGRRLQADLHKVLQ